MLLGETFDLSFKLVTVPNNAGPLLEVLFQENYFLGGSFLLFLSGSSTALNILKR